MTCVAVYIVREADGELWSSRVPDHEQRPELEHEALAALLARVATLTRGPVTGVEDGRCGDLPVALCCCGAYVDHGRKLALVYACRTWNPGREEHRVDRERRLADHAWAEGWELAMAWEGAHDLAAQAGLPACDDHDARFLDDGPDLVTHSLLTRHADPSRFRFVWAPAADQLRHQPMPIAPIELVLIDQRGGDERLTTHSLTDPDGLFAALGLGPALLDVLRAVPPNPGPDRYGEGAILDVPRRSIGISSLRAIAPATYAELRRRWPGWTVKRERTGFAGLMQQLGVPGDELDHLVDDRPRVLRRPRTVEVELDSLPPPPVVPADEARLLAAIQADPSADGPRLVYADLLQARRDPRGEYIAVQCELARLESAGQWSTRRFALERRERRLRDWYGHAELDGLATQLDRGFPTWIVAYDVDRRIGDALAQARTLESLMFGRELDARGVHELLAIPGLERLRGLSLFVGTGGLDALVDWTGARRLRSLDVRCSDLRAAVAEVATGLASAPSLAGLTRIRISGRYDNPGRFATIVAAMRLPALTMLGIADLGFDDVLADAVVANPTLAGLTTLEVGLRPGSIAALERVLPRMPALRHLRVRGGASGDAVTVLAVSPVLERLTSLAIPPELVSRHDRAELERRLGAGFSTTARALAVTRHHFV